MLAEPADARPIWRHFVSQGALARILLPDIYQPSPRGFFDNTHPRHTLLVALPEAHAAARHLKGAIAAVDGKSDARLGHKALLALKGDGLPALHLGFEHF